jgi:polyisoprenoid-binding protein YceI
MSTTTVQGLPRTGVWNIDPVHSTARFAVRHHAVATFRAGFGELSGSYDADAGKLVGEVTVASVQVPMDLLRDHLQRAEFFDAEHHPVIRFESSAISAGAAGAITVEGDLTIKGTPRHVSASGSVREPVAVRHQDGSEADHFGIDVELEIDRRDYGVEFNTRLPGGAENLGWDVTLEIALELVHAT